MLRIATLALFLVVSSVRAGTPLETADVEALKAFRLTSDNVRKAAAVTHQLAIEAAKDPALARFLAKKREQGESLEDQAKGLERDARVAGALRAESIGARQGSLRWPSSPWRSGWAAARPCSASSTRRCCGPCLTGPRSG